MKIILPISFFILLPLLYFRSKLKSLFRKKPPTSNLPITFFILPLFSKQMLAFLFFSRLLNLGCFNHHFQPMWLKFWIFLPLAKQWLIHHFDFHLEALNIWLLQARSTMPVPLEISMVTTTNGQYTLRTSKSWSAKPKHSLWSKVFPNYLSPVISRVLKSSISDQLRSFLELEELKN